MNGFFDILFDFYNGLINKLSSADVGGISLFSIILGAIAVSIVFNVFWKGEKG